MAVISSKWILKDVLIRQNYGCEKNYPIAGHVNNICDSVFTLLPIKKKSKRNRNLSVSMYRCQVSDGQLFIDTFITKPSGDAFARSLGMNSFRDVNSMFIRIKTYGYWVLNAENQGNEKNYHSAVLVVSEFGDLPNDIARSLGNKRKKSVNEGEKVQRLLQVLQKENRSVFLQVKQLAQAPKDQQTTVKDDKGTVLWTPKRKKRKKKHIICQEHQKENTSDAPSGVTNSKGPEKALVLDESWLEDNLASSAFGESEEILSNNNKDQVLEGDAACREKELSKVCFPDRTEGCVQPNISQESCLEDNLVCSAFNCTEEAELSDNDSQKPKVIAGSRKEQSPIVCAPLSTEEENECIERPDMRNKLLLAENEMMDSNRIHLSLRKSNVSLETSSRHTQFSSTPTGVYRCLLKNEDSQKIFEVDGSQRSIANLAQLIESKIGKQLNETDCIQRSTLQNEPMFTEVPCKAKEKDETKNEVDCTLELTEEELRPVKRRKKSMGQNRNLGNGDDKDISLGSTFEYKNIDNVFTAAEHDTSAEVEGTHVLRLVQTNFTSHHEVVTPSDNESKQLSKSNPSIKLNEERPWQSIPDYDPMDCLSEEPVKGSPIVNEKSNLQLLLQECSSGSNNSNGIVSQLDLPDIYGGKLVNLEFSSPTEGSDTFYDSESGFTVPGKGSQKISKEDVYLPGNAGKLKERNDISLIPFGNKGATQGSINTETPTTPSVTKGRCKTVTKEYVHKIVEDYWKKYRENLQKEINTRTLEQSSHCKVQCPRKSLQEYVKSIIYNYWKRGNLRNDP